MIKKIKKTFDNFLSNDYFLVYSAVFITIVCFLISIYVHYCQSK